MFSYKVDNREGNAKVQLNGDLDIDVSEIIEELIPRLLSFENLEFNFSGVPFVDSTGIGLLINLVETLKKNREDVQIQIKHVQPLVNEVFEMLQLQEILGDRVQLLSQLG